MNALSELKRSPNRSQSRACRQGSIASYPRQLIRREAASCLPAGAVAILFDIAPLPADARHIHHGVGHLAHVRRQPAAAAVGNRDPRRDKGPSGILDLTGVAQLVAVRRGSIFCIDSRNKQRIRSDRGGPGAWSVNRQPTLMTGEVCSAATHVNLPQMPKISAGMPRV